MTKHRVLIVGGGFGGIKTALELAGSEHVHVTLLSDRPDFRYYPTTYHTATGGLKSQSAIPLSTILHDVPNVELVLGRAAKLDRPNKALVTEDGSTYHYNSLVLALGSVTNYFGIQGLQEYSYGLKSMEEIQRFKTHLHDQLTADHKPDLNYVIVGAGPTGIELAGALPKYLRRIMTNHGIKHRAIHVDLIEAAPRLLPRSTKKVSRAVKRRLNKLGVKLYINQKVEGETADALIINGKPLTSHTVVWTAGVANNPFFKQNDFKLNERGKVIVDEHLLAENHIFVIGDNAATQFGGLAQTALIDGAFVAKTILQGLKGKKLPAYKPKRPITVIPAGPYWAAVEWGEFSYAGRWGWALRQAADWIGFKDVEPIWQATEQWMTEFGEQEDCPVCATKAATVA